MMQHDAFIPNYSVAKDAAKRFLKFYYSDKAMRIMAETAQSPVPVKLTSGTIDTSSWSSFTKECFEMSKSNIPIFMTMRSKFFSMNDFVMIYKYEPAQFLPHAANEADKWTSAKYITEETAYWTNNWEMFKKNAGLGS